MEPTLEFNKIFAFTYQWEKGLVNNPNDPGGLTKDGISDKSDGKLDGKFEGTPIEQLTYVQETAIYKTKYWDACRCDSLKSDVAAAVFDTAVNCGVARAVIWLEQSKTAEDVLECRRLHYKRIIEKNSKLKIFAKGWQNRLDALHKFVISIRTEQVL